MSKVIIYHSDIDRLLDYYVEPGSIDCAVFSPPYYRLRDYKVEGQIGWEKTPELYIGRMREVFYKLWNSLKDEGTIWMVIGDSYSSGGKGKWLGYSKEMGEGLPPLKTPKGYKPKDLLGIPWRLALALQGFSSISSRNIWDLRRKLIDAMTEKNWDKVTNITDELSEWAIMSEVEHPLWIRTDIIWNKTNSTPEMAKDRPHRSHEYIFLFSKKKNYYYDQALATHKNHNKTVWTIPTDSKKGHHATYPVDLATGCILAGCPPNGTVLDPFCGLGTTGLAALRVGRNAILGDISLKYCKMSYNRIKLENPIFYQVELLK